MELADNLALVFVAPPAPQAHAVAMALLAPQDPPAEMVRTEVVVLSVLKASTATLVALAPQVLQVPGVFPDHLSPGPVVVLAPPV